jgi:transposase
LITPTFGRDVLDGHLFLFFNRRRTQVKLLYWEPGGLALWTKRLEAGRYEMPARDADQAGLEVDAVELSLILGGVDLGSVKRRRRYDRPARNGAVAVPEKSS